MALEQRLKSEKENKRLKLVLERQIKIARSLEMLLEARPTTNERINLETTDGTVFERFVMELHAKGTQADYRVKQIVRRYVEEDRVVIVWRSYIDPVSFAGSPVSGAEFQEKGYLVTCYLISPALPIRSLSGERSVTGELTDFVLSGTEANVAAVPPDDREHPLRRSLKYRPRLTSKEFQSAKAIMTDSGNCQDPRLPRWLHFNWRNAISSLRVVLSNKDTVRQVYKVQVTLLMAPVVCHSDKEKTMAIALEDDSDAFTAALCFVDEFMGAGTDEAALSIALEGLPGSSPTDSCGPYGPLAAKAKASKRPMQPKKKRKGDEMKAVPTSSKACKTSRSSTRNRVRDQERRELLYLREKVADMQQKLQALEKTRCPAITASAVEAKQPIKESEEEAEAPAVWKEMASHQLEQRLKSERENRQLKMVLEGQIKIAKSLEKLLQARATTNAIESCLGDGQRLKRMHVSAPDRSDASIFKELMAGIDSAYREVDAVFHDNGLDKKESSFSDAEMHEGADGVYMKIFASKVLPFDVPATGTAAWRYFSRSLEHMPFRFLYHKDLQNMETTDDTIIESFGMELHAKGTQADYRVKQIVRRYVEEDRVVIVWRSYIDPVSFAGSPVSGAEFQEKGYLVVRRPRAMSPRFALLQTCYLISPALPIRSLSDERSVTGELTDFVLSGTEANVASCHQMIENILFNEAMKAHIQT